MHPNRLLNLGKSRRPNPNTVIVLLNEESAKAMISRRYELMFFPSYIHCCIFFRLKLYWKILNGKRPIVKTRMQYVHVHHTVEFTHVCCRSRNNAVI